MLESVNRWSHRRCCRLHLPVTGENKRAVLGGAQYHVRYLTLTSDQVRLGQANTNLLTEEEEINILFSILYLGACLPPHLQDHKENMRKVRRGRRSWRRSWTRRPVWAVKQSQQPKIVEEIFGKQNISFTEIIFLLIGRLLD